MALKKSTEDHEPERVRMLLEYTGDDLDMVRRLTEEGEIIPVKIHLVWERYGSQPWRRAVMGSRVIGPEKPMRGCPPVLGVRHKLLFQPTSGELKSWARLLPGLWSAIVEAESQLPCSTVNSLDDHVS